MLGKGNLAKCWTLTSFGSLLVEEVFLQSGSTEALHFEIYREVLDFHLRIVHKMTENGRLKFSVFPGAPVMEEPLRQEPITDIQGMWA